jgi:hypothetical protein
MTGGGLRAVDVHVASREILAPVCRDCAWWQTARGRESAADLRAVWERQVEDETGFFARALLDGDDVIGWMHVAPALLVPRALHLPSGPPSNDAYLLTCAYFYDEEFLIGFQHLLQEIEYALKARDVPALEAFALHAVDPDDRFRGYLREFNLFNPQVLEGNGFRRVRVSRGVDRLRLDLATLISVPRAQRAHEAVQPAPATQPV